MSTMVEKLRQARRISVPLVGIKTPDQTATIDELLKSLNGESAKFKWDVINGLLPASNRPNEWAILSSLYQTPIKNANDRNEQKKIRDIAVIKTSNLVECLVLVLDLPEDSMVFIHNAHRCLGEGRGGGWNLPVIQAIANLRDPFKATGRMLILLGPSINLPEELSSGDVMTFDEPFPTAEQLKGVVKQNFEDAGLKGPDDKTLERATDALLGCPTYAADQITAMSLTEKGLDMESLWERKRITVEQTRGLQIWRGGETFSDMGGNENIKQYIRALLAGKEAPLCIVWIDEIEKSMAGSKGDSSGVSQDIHRVLLTEIQNMRALGILLIGLPGSGKSMIAKCAGNEGKIPTIALDLGAVKGGIVGESEGNIRTVFKVIQAVSNGRVLILATCNSIASLSPELRRRFTMGTFYFDLPDRAEKDTIWGLKLKRYEIKQQPLPDDTDWTGAEIEKCCEISYRLNIPLVKAASNVVPVARADASTVEALRSAAVGNYISAAYEGAYKGAESNAPVVAGSGRKFQKQ